MIRRCFIVLISIPVLAALPAAADAQRATPAGVVPLTPRLASLDPIASHQRGVSFSDTAQTRRPRALPFVLGGAVLGGVIGGVLAAAYNPCSGDPDPGVYCTSTDPAAGFVIGGGVGAAAGLLLWALIRYSRPPAG